MTLQTLADRFWAKSLEARPTIATVRGVHDYDHLLPGLGDDWVAAISGAIRSIQEETEALDTTGMTTQDRITHSLLLHQCRSLLGELETPFRRVPIDPYLGPHTRLLSDTRQNTVADQSQADALLERYADVPRFLKEALDTHRACVEGGQSPAAALTQVWIITGSPVAVVTSPLRRSRTDPSRIGRTQPKQMPMRHPDGMRTPAASAASRMGVLPPASTTVSAEENVTVPPSPASTYATRNCSTFRS